MSDSFFQKVYDQVKHVPKGTVASYGQIAALCGNPRSARVVGWALKAIPHSTSIPWHRVVSASGHLTIVNPDAPAERQKQLLENEGVDVSWDKERELFKVDITTYVWKP